MADPKMKPCPRCGGTEQLAVYTYDNGARHVECSTTCTYLGPASTSIVWAIRNHNSQRDAAAARYLAALKDQIERLSALPAPVVPAEGPISTLEMVYRNMPDIPELPEAYQPRNIARSLAALRSAPPVGARVTDAARDVLAERQRQTEVEGWSAEHDDCHDRSELAQAAACYALSGTPVDEGLFIHGRWKDKIDLFWPFCRSWFRPTNRRRDLVKAGALILAEIERLDRAALLPAGEDGE